METYHYWLSGGKKKSISLILTTAHRFIKAGKLQYWDSVSQNRGAILNMSVFLTSLSWARYNTPMTQIQLGAEIYP